MNIKDSTGRNYGAKVDNQYRLHVDSVSRSQLQLAILQGLGFNISTGVLTLTTDSQSALIYLKNDSETPLIIKELSVRLGESTGGAGNALVSLSANPTAGTIISTATALSTQFNRDLSSGNILDGLFYKGTDGATLTGGSSAGATSTDEYPIVIPFDAAEFVLRKGNSIGLLFTPPAGNTSQNVVVFGTIYYDKSEL